MLVDLRDKACVGCGGSGEDLPLLKEACLADVAIEVMRQHIDHAGQEGGTQKRSLFGEGFSMATVFFSGFTVFAS